MELIQAEIETIREAIANLKQERTALTPNTLMPENVSPENIIASCKQRARETAQVSAEIKGIDDAIAILESQLNQKQNYLRQLLKQPRRHPLEDELEAAKEQAKIHAEQINELAAELAAEIKALKEVAHHLSPIYWQVYYKPFITGFKSISVPYVRSDGEVWTIFNRVV